MSDRFGPRSKFRLFWSSPRDDCTRHTTLVEYDQLSLYTVELDGKIAQLSKQWASLDCLDLSLSCTAPFETRQNRVSASERTVRRTTGSSHGPS